MLEDLLQVDRQDELDAKDAARVSVPNVEQSQPTKRRRRTRKQKEVTLYSILRDMYKNEPADMIRIVERRIGADTIEGVRALNKQTLNSNINSALHRYAGKVIAGDLTLTKTLEQALRDFADSHNLNYESMFTRRGKAQLVDAIRIVTGNINAYSFVGTRDRT